MILLQKEILSIINEWAEENKEPITLKEIITIKKDANPRTIRASCETMCRKGYLRRSCATGFAAYILIKKL
jgi:hypothetical protein